jgi:hypothetical protein
VNVEGEKLYTLRNAATTAATSPIPQSHQNRFRAPR